ncbi:MAG: hypothetical protein WAT23_12145 [Chromatiaceae bacterium]
MATDIIGHCWHCGHDLTPCDYGRESLCLGCGKPTRVCRNCRHYAPGRPNACLEPMTELVAEKERANFCELFDPADRSGGDSGQSRATNLLQRAQDLFK